MTKNNERQEKTALIALAEPICAAHQVELVDVVFVSEQGRAIVRVIIDRLPNDPNARIGSGVTLADCQGVSRDLSMALDVHDVVHGKFSLEVTSPGLDRPLVKETDFERFAGNEVKVQTSVPIGERRNFRGVLKGIREGVVELELDGAVVAIPHERIAKAHIIARL